MSSLHESTPEASRIASPEWRAERILARLDTLFEIGRAAGTNRPGLGEGEQRAFELVAGWMREAGLDVSRDRAGNLFGRRGDARIWSGSHLDSVPNGGRFDGALGVVAGIEVAARLPETELANLVSRMGIRIDPAKRIDKQVPLPP